MKNDLQTSEKRMPWPVAALLAWVFAASTALDVGALARSEATGAALCAQLTQAQPIQLAAVFVSFAFALRAFAPVRKPAPTLAVTAGILALLECWGLFLHETGTAFAQNGWLLAVFCALWAEFAVLLLAALQWLAQALTRAWPAQPSTQRGRLAQLWRRHPATVATLLVLVCWLVWILACYPGSLSFDMAFQITEYFGVNEMNQQHPVPNTLLMGWCARLGHMAARLTGLSAQRDNMAVFVYIFLQTAACAVAVGRTVRLEAEWGIRPRWQLATAAFFGLLPLFGAYMQYGTKDVLTSALLLMFALGLLRVVTRAAGGALWWGGFAFVAFAATCSRKECIGIIVVSGVAVALGFADVRKRLLAVTAAVAVLWAGVSAAVTVGMGVPQPSPVEAFSVPLQQMARVLRIYPEDVTPAQREFLTACMDADDIEEIAARYDPSLSDPVKGYVNVKYFTSNKWRCIQVWAQLGMRHPDVYLDSALAGSYGYWAVTTPLVPTSKNEQPGLRAIFESGLTFPGGETLEVHVPQSLEGVRALFARLANCARGVPVLNLLYCFGVYTWLLAALAVLLFRAHKGRYTLCFLPALLQFLVCCASPVNDNFRYFSAVVMITPAMVAFAARVLVEPTAPRDVQ